MSDSNSKRLVVQSYRRLGAGSTPVNPYPTVGSGAMAIERRSAAPQNPWPEWMNHRMVTNSESMDDYLRAVQGKENAPGDPRAMNPGSSATGLFQFTRPTAERYGLDWERDRFNPEAQRAAMVRMTEDNKQRLQAAGYLPTYSNLYLLHFAGPSGGMRVLRAQDDTPIAQVLDRRAIEANRSILSGRTVGELKAWAARDGAMDGGPAGSKLRRGPPLLPLEPPAPPQRRPSTTSPTSPPPNPPPEGLARKLLRRKGLPRGLF